MPAGPKPDKESEDLDSLAHEYAWNWFSYHAQQRLGLFNISLVAIAAAATGAISAKVQGWNSLAAIISAFGAVLSLAFLRLDQRNSELTKLAEEHLKVSEQRLAEHVGNTIKLSALANNPTKNVFYTFGQVSRTLYIICAVTGIIGCIYYSLCTN